MALGTHNFRQDPRNAEILISVNGKLYPRDKAMVSVFDSGFILGDGVWEGLRCTMAAFRSCAQHIERLYEGAKAIFMDIGLDPGRARRPAVRLPRRQWHERRRPYPPDGDARRQGDALSGSAGDDLAGDHRHHPRIQNRRSGKSRRGACASTRCNVRRGYPDVQDQKLNSHSKLNCITACIQAANAGADEALMLDPAWLRRHLQLDAFLHRAPRRGLDLDRAVLHPRHHARQHHRGSVATTAFRFSKSPSRSMTSMGPTKPS